MKVTVMPARALTADLIRRWSQIQRDNAALASPFFCPEFTLAVGSVRSDAEVGVIEERGEVVGFFPFQRRRWNIGKPIGGRLSDYQAVIARSGFECPAEELVRGCRLRAWDFDHLLTSQSSFQPYLCRRNLSPMIDLSQGFEAYCSGRIRQLFSTLARKRRKCEREAGPLRFEAHVTDRGVLETLIAWKAEQYRRSHVTNVFAYGWTTTLLKHILAAPSDGFRGMLSALYIRERLAAVEFWLCSARVIHSWFPAYDPALGRFSPGMLLMADSIRTAESLGIRRIDLGRGMSQFKTSFMSSATEVAEGSVACHPAARAWRSTSRKARQTLTESRLKGVVRFVGRWTRPIRGWMAFR